MERHSTDRKEIFEGYVSALETKLDNPDDITDPYIPLRTEAWLSKISDPIVQDGLVDLFLHRNNSSQESLQLLNSPGTIIEVLNRVFHYDALISDNRSFPADYQTVQSWKGLIAPLFYEDTYLYDMRSRDVQSNIDLRYVNCKILSLMFKDRLGSNPTVYDFGCSRNHGLRRLARNGEFAFDPINVIDADYDSPPAEGPSEDTTIDQANTITLNSEFVQAPFYLGKSIGIDGWSTRDQGNMLWVKGCTYPAELWDPTRLERFDELEHETENVGFAQADCSDALDLAKNLPPDRKADIVFISTMLYQNDEASRVKILENAKQYANHFVIVLDAADKDDSLPSGLRFPTSFYSSQRPFGYKALVLDVQKPEEGFRELLRYENGRCRNVILNLGDTAIQASFKS